FWQIASMNTGATRMLIDPNGNVGIATLTPGSFKLSVNGLGGLFDGVFGTGRSYGVTGQSASGIGVYGFSDQSIGVYGSTNSGWAALFDGKVKATTLGSGGAGSPLCRNFSNEIADCSSSLRYKTDVRPFSSGLDIVQRLRPIAFTWKEGGAHDVGLAAE